MYILRKLKVQWPEVFFQALQMLALLFKERSPSKCLFSIMHYLGWSGRFQMLVCFGFFGLLQSFISLNLKACKFSLYVSKNTRDLENEADQIPERACTSKLPTWNQKARGETIYPKPTVDVIVSKNKLEETKTKEFILSFTRQEIRSCTTVQRRKRFKQAIRNIKPSNGSC